MKLLNSAVLALGLTGAAQAQGLPDDLDDIVTETYVFENCSAVEGKPPLTMGDVAGVATQMRAKIVQVSTLTSDSYKAIQRASILNQRQELATYIQEQRAKIDQFVTKLDAVSAKNDEQTGKLLDDLIKEISDLFATFESWTDAYQGPTLPEVGDIRLTNTQQDIPHILNDLGVTCKDIDKIVDAWFNPQTHHFYGEPARRFRPYSPSGSLPPIFGRRAPNASRRWNKEQQSSLEKFQFARETVGKFRISLTENQAEYSRKLTELALEVDPPAPPALPPVKKGRGGGKK